MGVRINPAGRNGGHAAPSGKLLGSLEAQTGLLIDPNVAKLHPIRIPLIKLPLVYEARPPVFEPAVNALLPEVCRFDDVRVR